MDLAVFAQIDIMERYKRQLMLNGFSADHQKKLSRSAALVAGIGGLGGTAALYLAAAGIGRLVLVHRGDLTLSNMNRQILMREDWIGRPRVIMAQKRIQEINSEVEVEIHDTWLSEETAPVFTRDADIALSARPNFVERRLLNAACVGKGIPMVEAAMNGMEAYLFNIIPGVTPCLNCVFPVDDPEWQELGFPVLGAVSGTLGGLMAVEAIKILTGFGKPLASRMLTFNLLDMHFTTLNIHRDEQCPVCSTYAASAPEAP
ncbi:MAG: HesA/MoeB/ThiF family protein [Thermodesulfovibrionales bacterium]